MSDTMNSLMAQQRAQLQSWRDETDDIGGFIASDVWETLERELEEQTQDGLIWDCAPFIKNGLQITMGSCFDEACEKWITRRLEKLSEAMQKEAGENWCFDTALSSLDQLRKGLRMGQRFTPRFDQLFESAKPGFFDRFSRAIADDVDYVCNQMEKDAHKDATRLRAVFQEAGRDIRQEIAEAGSDLLRRAIRGYQDALGEVESHQQTAAALAD